MKRLSDLVILPTDALLFAKEVKAEYFSQDQYYNHRPTGNNIVMW